MVDLAEYINEAKRDYEMTQIINDVQVCYSFYLIEPDRFKDEIDFC